MTDEQRSLIIDAFQSRRGLADALLALIAECESTDWFTRKPKDFWNEIATALEAKAAHGAARNIRIRIEELIKKANS